MKRFLRHNIHSIMMPLIVTGLSFLCSKPEVKQSYKSFIHTNKTLGRKKPVNRAPTVGHELEKGDEVICSLPLVRSYSTGVEFVEPMMVRCKILKVNPAFKHEPLSAGILHLDCADSIRELECSKPGVGIVKGHKLNRKKRFEPEQVCYKI